MNSVIFFKVKLFADDDKIYIVIDDINKCAVLQDGLDKLFEWSVIWQLNLAKDKCHILHIGKVNENFNYNVENNALPQCKQTVDLRVTIYHSLRLSCNIDNIVNKANARSALILRCFKSREPKLLLKAFDVYVRPVLEYCCQVWNPSYKCDINKIEAAQRRFTKKCVDLEI